MIVRDDADAAFDFRADDRRGSAGSLASGRGLAGAESVGLGAAFEDVSVEGDAVDDRRNEPRSGKAVPQRLTHRPAIHPVTVGELADRQRLPPPIPPDLLEQLHPRPHLHRPPAGARRDPTGRSERGWGQHS